MKKIALAALLATMSVGAMAAASNVCTGGTSATSAQVTAGTNFIKNGFTAKCSANVYLSYDEDATKVAVGAASKKGKSVFAGSSEGGSVTGTTCAAATCAQSDASSAATTALAASS